MDALGMTKGAVSKIISRQLPIQPSTDPNYYADYRARCTTYYLPDGASHGVPLLAPQVDIPVAFDASALQTAIRGAQTGVVHYPEFMQLSMAAGCVGYLVWIAGRHVSYFGRKGEVHVEHFPGTAD